MNKTANVCISGTGVYYPKKKVLAEELDSRFGMPTGSCVKMTGVEERYFVSDETASEMATAAAEDALAAAGARLSDLDAIVSVSAVTEQPIPCQAALIQKRLGGGSSGIPCWDINATCLGFVTALDLLSVAIDAGRFQRVLILSSEVASAGLNWKGSHDGFLFGDAAVAAVLEKTPEHRSSKVFASSLETYSQWADLTQIRGGGTRLAGTCHTPENNKEFLYEMDGPAVLRCALQTLPGLARRTLAKCGLSMDDLDLVIPHHAAGPALKIVRRKVGVPREKWFHVVAKVGNVVSASVPFSLHEAIRQERLQPGQKCMLLGTGAGLSLGVVVFEY